MVFESRPLPLPHTEHSESDTPLETAAARNTGLPVPQFLEGGLSSWESTGFQCFSSSPQLLVSGNKSQASAVKKWGLPSLSQLLQRLLLWSITQREACHCPYPQLPRFLPGGEAVIKQIGSNLFQKKLISFAKELGKI